MATLADLGLTTDDGTIMLIAPPDAVLAESALMRPRPSVAVSLLVAEPAARIIWWTERALLQPGNLERLRWLVSGTEGGLGWLIFDPDDDEPVSAAEAPALLHGSGLQTAQPLTLPSGEVALPIRIA